MSEDVQRNSWSGGGQDTASVELRSDWSEHGVPSTGVVQAVAAVRDVDPVELPPLNDHVDPDALDRLLTDDGDASVQVSFQYAGTEIYVRGSGAVEVSLDGG